MSLFGWGSCLDGQLGLGGIEEDKVVAARLLNGLDGDERRVAAATCGLAHSLLLLQDGTVFSCGSDEFGQLGRPGPVRRFRRVPELAQVTQVAAGAHFSLALAASGQLFAWGCNDKGQLGRADLGDRGVQLVATMLSHHVVQVACGAEHVVCLTRASQVLAWGGNEEGQLGLGPGAPPFASTPAVLASLHDVPVRQVAAGGFFSFCLSVSGYLFAWGRNDVGQLGLSDAVGRAVPVRCASLKTQPVVRVSCGEAHSLFLTRDGGVFSCGGGGSGQLGHNSRSNVLVPTKIFELMGRHVAQVAAGRRHSLVLTTAPAALLCFGLGASGQLGTGGTGDRLSPAPLPALDAPLAVREVFCGYGDTCFLAADPAAAAAAAAQRPLAAPAIEHLSAPTLRALQALPEGAEAASLREAVQRGLGSLAALSVSFLDGERHLIVNAANPGVDMDLCGRVMQRLAALGAEAPLRAAARDSVSRAVRAAGQQRNFPSPECLRVFLLLSQTFDLFLPSAHAAIVLPFCAALDRLDSVPKQYLERWLAVLPIRHSKRLLGAVKESLLRALTERAGAAGAHAAGAGAGAMPEATRIADPPTVALLNALRLLRASNSGRDGAVLRSDAFYVDALPELFDVAAEYYHWVLARRPCDAAVSLCDYPFIFNGVAKSAMLRMDARIQMSRAVEKANAANFVALYNRTVLFDLPELLFRVRREHILEDTVTNLGRYDASDLKKPLRVVFEGEEAQDEGGVRKEYLMLFFRALLDPNFAMFRYYEETRMLCMVPRAHLRGGGQVRPGGHHVRPLRLQQLPRRPQLPAGHVQEDPVAHADARRREGPRPGGRPVAAVGAGLRGGRLRGGLLPHLLPGQRVVRRRDDGGPEGGGARHPGDAGEPRGVRGAVRGLRVQPLLRDDVRLLPQVLPPGVRQQQGRRGRLAAALLRAGGAADAAGWQRGVRLGAAQGRLHLQGRVLVRPPGHRLVLGGHVRLRAGAAQEVPAVPDGQRPGADPGHAGDQDVRAAERRRRRPPACRPHLLQPARFAKVLRQGDPRGETQVRHRADGGLRPRLTPPALFFHCAPHRRV
jgi:E3 ubiquitin-protein ligase HERC4